MSKIGVSTARKTKYKPTGNNPFQGPTVISFNSNRPPFASAFLQQRGKSPVKNSAKPFVINRLKPSDPGGPGATYGDNSALLINVAQAQLLSEEEGININFGVNNNLPLLDTDGIVSIEVLVTDDRGNPISCLSGAEEIGSLRPNATGLFTKQTGGLRDGDNFSFSLQQAVEATGVPPEEATGTLYMIPEVLPRGPGEFFDLVISPTITYSVEGLGSPVALDGCSLTLRLFWSEP